MGKSVREIRKPEKTKATAPIKEPAGVTLKARKRSHIKNPARTKCTTI